MMKMINNKNLNKSKNLNLWRSKMMTMMKMTVMTKAIINGLPELEDKMKILIGNKDIN